MTDPGGFRVHHQFPEINQLAPQGYEAMEVRHMSITSMYMAIKGRTQLRIALAGQTTDQGVLADVRDSHVTRCTI